MCCTDAAGGRLAVKPPGTSSKGIDANCVIWFQGRSPTTILARAPQVLRQSEDFRKEFLRNRIANNYIWNSVGSRRTKHWIYLVAERAKTGWGKKRKETVGKDVARRNKIHKWPWALPLVGAKYTLPKSPGKAWVE